MAKVVYNDCYGGYSLSWKAAIWLAENGREEIQEKAKKELQFEARFGYRFYDVPRHDPDLVRCVEELGEAANGRCAELKVRELKGNRYRIEEYDGLEEVMEPKDYKYIEVTE